MKKLLFSLFIMSYSLPVIADPMSDLVSLSFTQPNAVQIDLLLNQLNFDNAYHKKNIINNLIMKLFFKTSEQDWMNLFTNRFFFENLRYFNCAQEVARRTLTDMAATLKFDRSFVSFIWECEGKPNISIRTKEYLGIAISLSNQGPSFYDIERALMLRWI